MESRFDEMKRYVRFTEADALAIVAVREAVRPHFQRIAQEFYDRIREHEEAHAVIVGEEQLARLQRSLVAWLERLFGGVYDEAYCEQTSRVGRVHVKVGLPQRYMFTAMALIRSSLTAVIDEAAGASAREARDALGRLLDLELAIMVESYREDSIARIERVAATERAALSLRAARVEQRYATAVELCDAVIIGLSSSGSIVLFNTEAERVTGYARDEALGRDVDELLFAASGSPDGPASRWSGLLRAAPNEPRTVEVPMRTRAGKIRDVRLRVVGVPAAPDGARADDEVDTIAIGHDVTEERAARQRAQVQERLATAGTLAAGLAHEIRNPLNGAKLHISLLERWLQTGAVEASRGEAAEATTVVRDEIDRLARLVTEFLEFARPQPLAIARTSVRALCERAVTLVTPKLGAGVDLRLDLPAADISIDGDQARLEQVLSNLLENAIDAVAPRGGHVVLRARREPRRAWIEVEDDGPGLPGPGAPVFDAFFSTKPNGTGLGLAIVHRVVMDHGGAVDVHDEPGRTRFRVTLPLEHPNPAR